MTSAPSCPTSAESGSIEQDADTVLFTYRPAYYLERQRFSRADAEANRMAELEAVKNKMELLIEKQRSGPIGTINLWCDMAANKVFDPTNSMKWNKPHDNQAQTFRQLCHNPQFNRR